MGSLPAAQADCPERTRQRAPIADITHEPQAVQRPKLPVPDVLFYEVDAASDDVDRLVSKNGRQADRVHASAQVACGKRMTQSVRADLDAGDLSLSPQALRSEC